MNNVSTLILFVKSLRVYSDVFDEEDLSRTLTEMEKPEVGPSERSVDSIINFARSYEVLETKETGHVEMILN